MGCPPDYFSSNGQAWGFPVLDPAKLFNKDGSLGVAGKVLYDKYFDMARNNPGGVRIDHIIGLIDPFVYKNGTLPSHETAGRLFSSPAPDFKDVAKTTTQQYADILEKIVIKACTDAGLTKDDIVCEDLGALTDATLDVMKALALRGIRVTQFADAAAEDHMYRGKNVTKNDIITLATHDNAPSLVWAQDMINSPGALEYGRYLAKDLYNNEELASEIVSSPEKLVQAKMQELFNSPAKSVQIFVSDLFGIKERYNLPGVELGNWSLRVGADYRDAYYKGMEDGTMPNIADLIAKALKSKGVQSQKLIARLENYAKTFYEKS
jgi:4-alpha-glucanotransferase